MDAPLSPEISPEELGRSLRGTEPTLVIDVRQAADFRDSSGMIVGALRRDPERVDYWARELPAASNVVVYCARGGDVSQGVAHALTDMGIAAQYLAGGFDGWTTSRDEVDRKPVGAGTRWVTRERPKIDRIACPWLIARFVDRDAEFLYVPTPEVKRVASERDAIAYDIPDVRFSHDGDRCSFDAFLRHYRLTDPALRQLAVIVRGADTAKLELAPQAPGLAAVSLGLSRLFGNDHEMLKHGMVMYDALYAWCRNGQDELHTWNPDAYR